MTCSCTLWTITAVVVAVLALVVYICSDKIPHMDIKGKNILITGGSSGIGLATAEEAVKRGAASIAIVARTQRILDEATAKLEALAKTLKKDTKIYNFSADVSNEEHMTRVVNDYAAAVSAIDIVVASAGVSHPNYFAALPIAEFERIIRINYIGAVVTCKTVSEHMKAHKGGRIVLVSSMAGLAGIHGYSAYSPTKFAVRGLAECLAMELKPFNITVSLCNPPDVDTPMYAEENKTKPEECLLISEGTGVFPAAQLATDICNGIEDYKFFIQTGFDGFMIGLLTSGFAPAGGFAEAALQVLLMSPMRLVAIVYRFMYDRIVAQVHAKRATQTKKAQ